MELQQLQYFLVAAKYEHITKAANSLHIAQPALSQSIKRLEAELGVKLFDRKKGGITLSASGKLLVEELKPIMKSLDNLPKKLSETARKQQHPFWLQTVLLHIKKSIRRSISSLCRASLRRIMIYVLLQLCQGGIRPPIRFCWKKISF